MLAKDYDTHYLISSKADINRVGKLCCSSKTWSRTRGPQFSSSSSIPDRDLNYRALRFRVYVLKATKKQNMTL